MAEVNVSLTDLRQNLASLINRAAFGGERIILVSHGEPKAAIIGIEDLRRLEQLASEQPPALFQYASQLAAADIIRERIALWEEARGSAAEDSTETLRMLRERDDDESADLR